MRFEPSSRPATPCPIILAYPRVYENMRCPQWHDAVSNVIAKCYELWLDRPSPTGQHGGYYGLGGPGDNRRLYLMTLWARQPGESDLFVIGGWGDDFHWEFRGPGKERLRRGDYAPLIPVPLL